MPISFTVTAITAKLISAFVFATRIVHFLFYLNPKFQDSSSFLCLYRSVCVRPGRKPHCWFSHEAAHFSKNVLVYVKSYIQHHRTLALERPSNTKHTTMMKSFFSDQIKHPSLYTTVKFGNLHEHTIFSFILYLAVKLMYIKNG